MRAGRGARATRRGAGSQLAAMPESNPVREIGAEEIGDAPGPTVYLSSLLRDGPSAYVENARVTMRALAIDDLVVPLVVAEPIRQNSDICSPHSHYVGYPLRELTKRRSPLAMLGFRAAIG